MRAEDKPEKPGKPVGDKPGDKPVRRPDKPSGEERRAEREVRRAERRRERVRVDGRRGEVVGVESFEEFSVDRPDPITRPDALARRDRVTVVLPRERLEDLAEVIRGKYPERVSTDVLAEWVIERLDAELGP